MIILEYESSKKNNILDFLDDSYSRIENSYDLISLENMNEDKKKVQTKKNDRGTNIEKQEPKNYVDINNSLKQKEIKNQI